MIPFGVHLGRIEHDIVHGTVSVSRNLEKRITFEQNTALTDVQRFAGA